MIIPKNITEENVLQAIKDIDTNGIKYPLTNIKKYDLVYNGKIYPLKYTISLANQFANGNYLSHKEFNTYQAQDYLKNLSPSFVIQQNENDLVAELIEKYKTHIKANGLDDEIYKWKLVAECLGRPDVAKANFYEELKSLKFYNLVFPVAISVINQIAEERVEPFRECFKVLFNEEIPLSERVKYFDEESLKIYREFVPEIKFQHYQDERTIATFLTYHNPEIYSLYKYSVYRKFCKLLGLKANKKGEKYVHYMELINDFIVEYISEDNELLKLITPLLNSPDCFSDKKHMILAQDILYQVLETLSPPNEVIALMASDGTGWQERYIKGMENLDAAILWNSKRPSGTTKTLKFLRDIIDDGDSFNLYYSTKGVITYKAKIIDFIENQTEFEKKKWNNKYTIYDYHDNIDSYAEDNKSAKIIFLAETLEKTKPISISEFKFLDGYSAPVQDNLSPIKKEPEEFEVFEKVEELSPPSRNNNDMNNKCKPLNQILFGPPGTGKTYNTINKAIAIANPDFDLDQSRSIIKKEFEKLMKEGQVVFTTFHQSMSYEDFIEGIKPLKPNPEDQFLKYDVIPGILKKICQDAKTPNLIGFDLAYENLKNELAATDVLSLKTPTGKDFSISLNSNDNLTLHTGPTKEKQGTLTKENIQKQLNGEIKFKGWEGYFKGVIENLKTKHSYSENGKVSDKNYVLIIDEINRGNVSQIFGELITLIEEDKRLGKDEALEVTLPYSKDKFGVPSNLFIIGTMNTADRSVEAIDTALRRRFCFEEVPPKYDLIELQYDFEGIKGFEILRNLNKRIEKLLDKDHQIGHSYFMKKNGDNIEERLLSSFYENIIPLLQEYFFGDFGKIGLVLGQGFVRKKEWSPKSDSFAGFNYQSSSEFDDREVFEIIDYRSPKMNKTITVKGNEVEMDFQKALKLLMNKDIE